MKVIKSIFVLICLGIVSCARNNANLTIDTSKYYSPKKINSVVVLPLTSNSNLKLNEESLKSMTVKLISSLEAKTSLEILNLKDNSQVHNAYDNVKSQSLSNFEKAVTVGNSVDAQGVIYGDITTYRESNGSKYGASVPAGAGFKLWLVDPKTKVVLAVMSFKQDEETLTDNIFNLKEKFNSSFAFRDADELLINGFNEAASELETIRKNPLPN
ncbi:MAG: hypothetical protein KBC84_06030 [Proteobacteria bacterium]|nr:hypothetical protein [Pseudomonadota bacterium]